MQKARLIRFSPAVVLSLAIMAASGMSAESPRIQTISAGRVEQVFAQVYPDPVRVGGWNEPDNVVLAQITINLENASLLVITFSAVAATLASPGSRSGNTVETQADIACMVDDTLPCQPRAVYFRAPSFWYAQSFTWIAHGVSKGKHTVSIGASYKPARPSPAPAFHSRILVVEAAKL